MTSAQNLPMSPPRDGLAPRGVGRAVVVVVRIGEELHIRLLTLVPAAARLHQLGILADVREAARVAFSHLRAALRRDDVLGTFLVHLHDVGVHALEVALIRPVCALAERRAGHGLPARSTALRGVDELRQRVHLLLQVEDPPVLLAELRGVIGGVLVHAPRVIRGEVLQRLFLVRRQLREQRAATETRAALGDSARRRFLILILIFARFYRLAADVRELQVGHVRLLHLLLGAQRLNLRRARAVGVQVLAPVETVDGRRLRVQERGEILVILTLGFVLGLARGAALLLRERRRDVDDLEGHDRHAVLARAHPLLRRLLGAELDVLRGVVRLDVLGSCRIAVARRVRGFGIGRGDARDRHGRADERRQEERAAARSRDAANAPAIGRERHRGLSSCGVRYVEVHGPRPHLYHRAELAFRVPRNQ